MKKIISIFLFGCMLVHLMAGNAWAAATVVGGASDGVTTFGDVQSKSQFHVTVLDRASRYAVDLEYGSLTVSFEGGLVWDVNNLEYVYSGGDDADKEKKTVSLTIINHSDRPIEVETDFNQKYPISSEFIYSGDDPEDGTILGVAVGSDKPQSKTVTVELEPSVGWSDIAALAGDEKEIDLGEVTITITTMDGGT